MDQTTATLSTSIERYHMLFQKMEKMLLNMVLKPEGDCDPDDARRLFDRLSKMLMAGLKKNQQIADDDLTLWEEGFIIQLEPLYLTLKYGYLKPNRKLYGELWIAYESVFFWRQTLAMYLRVGGPADEDESADEHDEQPVLLAY